jgi:heme a synthase
MTEANRGLHLYASFTAIATFLLIFAGGLVTSTGSGLSVPDWPLSFGTLMPEMKGGVVYEHSHRLIAGSVAILILALMVWLALREPRRWVRALGFTAFGAVLVQALLGGLTVLFKLPTMVSSAHATLGQSILCLTVVIAMATSAGWARTAAGAPAGSRLPRLTVLAAAAVYIQLVIGAVMRHMNAGLAIPDFPLAFGSLIPPHWSKEIVIHFTHRLWAVVVFAHVVLLIVRLFREGRYPRLAALLTVLLPLQVGLGALTVLSGKQVIITTCHVSTGAAILAVCVALAVLARRSPLGAGRMAPAAAPHSAVSV